MTELDHTPDPSRPQVDWDRDWLARHCTRAGRALSMRYRVPADRERSAVSGQCFTGPRVINRHHYKSISTAYVYIGRGSPLGNPYTLAKHGPSAMGLYERWLWDKIKARDPAVMQALRSITHDHALVCSCSPRPCHGDVVVRAWNWLRSRRGDS